MTTRAIQQPPALPDLTQTSPEIRAYMIQLDAWLRQSVIDWEKMPKQTAATGGAGSAGSGNQYVPLKIEGTTYKVLHDGTV